MNGRSFTCLRKDLNRSVLYHCLLISIASANSFISCNEIQKCPQFEYGTFGIDTNSIKLSYYLINHNDSVLIAVNRIAIVSEDADTSSFMKMADCNNGIYIDMNCERLNLDLSYYFQRSDAGYSYVLYSSHFTTRRLNYLQSVEDVNIRVTDIATFNGKTPRIKSLEIAKGKVESVTDIHNNVWKARTTSN